MPWVFRKGQEEALLPQIQASLEQSNAGIVDE